SERDLRTAESALLSSKAKLRSKLGRADADPKFDVVSVPNVPAIEILSADAAYQLALQNRPDVQSLRMKMSQAQANVELERRKAYQKVAPLFDRPFAVRARHWPGLVTSSFAAIAHPADFARQADTPRRPRESRWPARSER